MTRVFRDNFVIKKRYSFKCSLIEIEATKYSIIVLEAYPLANNRG